MCEDQVWQLSLAECVVFSQTIRKTVALICGSTESIPKEMKMWVRRITPIELEADSK